MAIYGLILAEAIVAGVSEDDQSTAGELAFLVAGSMGIFWLAHVYSEVLGHHLEAPGGSIWAEIAREVRASWPMLVAGVWVLVPLVLSALGVFSVDTAVGLALTLAVVALFLWGLRLGRQDGLGWTGSLVAGGLNALFGLLIIALKSLH